MSKQLGQEQIECGVYTVEEAAARLGIGRTRAYECVRRGEWPAIRIGGCVRIPKAFVEGLLSGEQGEA